MRWWIRVENALNHICVNYEKCELYEGPLKSIRQASIRTPEERAGMMPLLMSPEDDLDDYDDYDYADNDGLCIMISKQR